MLAAALVGPWRGIVVMAVVLAVQALLFQDGGVTAFGANLLAMGGGGCLAGHAVAVLARRVLPGPRGLVAGPVVGAFVGTLVGAAAIALLLAVSGLYPAAAVLPLMLSLHVPIGLLEAALTGAILATVLRWRPDLVRGLEGGGAPAPALGGLFVALAIAAFLAPFASPLPDGLESVAEKLGFAEAARALWPAPAPDYALPWAALGRAGTALAGLLGTVAAAALALALSRGLAAPPESRPHE
jgi:cobalt/nickel transport system permease protein